MEQKCYGIRNIASFPAGMLPVLPSCHVTLTPCCIVPWQQSVATRLIQIACCYGANIRSGLRVTTRTRLTRGNFTRRLGYRRAKCPAVALWWIIHELNCSICGLIIFTVVTDQHSAAISVQAVDDVGYSLPSWFLFQIFNPLSKIKSFLEQNRFFLDGSIWFPVFLAPLC